MIKWTATRFEDVIIEKIAARAASFAKAHGQEYTFRDAWMDIEATHCNGCPLDLNRLLSAADCDFGHDIFGIRKHIDRTTGKLTGLFDPRCSLPVRNA